MKSNIVFFDSMENSKRGTLRGIILFPIFIIMSLIWFFITKNWFGKYFDKTNTGKIVISLIVSGILIVSAITVHNPNSVSEVIVYGALVGLVVYGVANSTLLSVHNKWEYIPAIIDTTWGVASTALMAYILYMVVKKWPNMLAVV